MQKLSKINSNLICITGKMGSGKTTIINELKKRNYETIIMDEYIKEIYQKDEIGYNKILKFFGKDFIGREEVNRQKLLLFIKQSPENKRKLDNLMIPIIEKKISNLPISKLIFVELGIFIYFPFIFKKFFKKIILIDKKNDFISNDIFSDINKNIYFSTNDVGKEKKGIFSNIVYVDYIVENIGNLEYFCKSVEKILDYIKK